MILIYSENENAHVGHAPKIVNGVHRHYRSHRAEGHFLVVDGDDEELIAHDAELIVALPGFRLATAEEQEQFARAQQAQSGAITEKQDASPDAQQPSDGAGKGSKGGKGKANA